MWPFGLLAAFVGLFVVGGTSDRFGYDVLDVGFGASLLEIQFSESAAGMPVEALRLPSSLWCTAAGNGGTSRPG